MARIPLVNLAAQYRSIKSEIDAAVARVLEANDFIMGGDVPAFEKEFADFCGAAHAVGCANGTDAITLVLRAAGIGRGDTVITVPNTFIASTEACSNAGADFAFVDVLPDTLLLDPSRLDAAIADLKKAGRKPRAVLAVHLYGQPCDMDAIRQVAGKHDLVVLEDAAQAHGATYRGRRAGTLGLAATFSFFPGKNLGAYGDAGAVVTNDERIARAVAQLRNHGRTGKYEHDLEGFNSRLDTIQAAVLRVKLRHLSKWTEHRAAVADRYAKNLRGTPGVVLPVVAEGVHSANHLFVIRTPQRELVRTALKERGIESGVHYPLPLHLQPAYKHLGYRAGSFPVAEAAAGAILSLPVDGDITFSDVDEVSEIVAKVARANS
jgi:dTDP-4-amino-4,6-dideoxygalactose transaminase